MPKIIFCLMGPTAAGKTALACELTTRFPLEIVSVDSAMIYKEMNIGTAKPQAEELLKYPHHLIDIINPIESYSAAQFCEDGVKQVEDIYSRNKIPLLVGGTMMYFRALQQGLSPLPAANEAIRAALLLQAERQGWDALHQQLSDIDPLAAERIHNNDTQRIQRALEVYQLTGKPLSFFWKAEKNAANFRFANLILLPDQRAWLHRRIASRFEQMLAQDFVGEVAALLQKWHLTPTCPAMRSVGYRQVLNYLAGDYSYEHLQEKGIAATRQLAKRQLTWLRQWQDASYFSCESVTTSGEVIDLISKILDNSENSKR